MVDQLRANAGKLELGYWMAMRAQGTEVDEDFVREFALGGELVPYSVESVEIALGRFVRGQLTHDDLLDVLQTIFGGEDALAEAFCTACTKGAVKYERGNFMLGAPLSQYIDCASRHLKAIRLTGAEYSETFKALNGEQVTQQLNHWHNVAWNVVMIFEVMEAAPQRDDRLFHMGNFAGEREVLACGVCEGEVNVTSYSEPEDACSCYDTCLRCK